jgi:hypothetical protein
VSKPFLQSLTLLKILFGQLSGRLFENASELPSPLEAKVRKTENPFLNAKFSTMSKETAYLRLILLRQRITGIPGFANSSIDESHSGKESKVSRLDTSETKGSLEHADNNFE